jgi:uncharacterized protein involved in response to NO
MTAIPGLAAGYRGPALFSYGFRPFFLLGSAYAAIGVLIWLPVYFGEAEVPTGFIPRDWHVHEMLYGYLAAVISGFLLTAIPNWTGRLPLQGRPLLVLVAVWAAGRIAVSFSATTGAAFAGVVDSCFLLLMVAAVAREIVAGRNWRNLVVLVPVGGLAAGNIGFHVEAALRGHAEYSAKVAIVAIVTLIMIIGGRVVPSFTRNWLARRGPGRLPAPLGRFDAVALITSVLALLLWIVVPLGIATAIVLLSAAALNALRLARWAGERTFADRLVLILHVGFAFVPLGFLLSGLAALDVVPYGAGIHAWMAGAAGTMTLAVMTRASLGHTGRPLVASRVTELIYAAVVLGAAFRIAAVLAPPHAPILLHGAAIGWVLAFGGFVLLFGPILGRGLISTEPKSD